MFNWIRVRGLVTSTGPDDDPTMAQHNIRVFAHVEGVDKQAIATQGELGSYSTREDACESGCLAACERATTSAIAEGALETCRLACENACTMPDASGKFSAVVYGTQLEGVDKGSAPKDDKKRLGVERGELIRTGVRDNPQGGSSNP